MLKKTALCECGDDCGIQSFVDGNIPHLSRSLETFDRYGIEMVFTIIEAKSNDTQFPMLTLIRLGLDVLNII